MTTARAPLLWGVLIVFVCIATLVIVEVAARLVFKDNRFTIHPDSVVFQHDSLLGWKGIPNYQGVPRQEYGAKVSINASGFRDSDWGEKLDLAAQTNRKKVLFVGDSTLYGARINAGDRITEQFASIYAGGQNEEIAVFNAGIPGFGTGQEYRTLSTLLPVIEPDIVVVRFTSNDIGDSALPFDHRYSRRVYKPFYNYDGELVLNAEVPKRFSYAVQGTQLEKFRARFLIDQIQKVMDEFKYRPYGIPKRELIYPKIPIQRRWFEHDRKFGFDSIFNLYQYKGLFKKNSQRNVALFRKIKEMLDEKGIRFLLLVDFSTGDDAIYAERILTSRLANHDIETVNIHRILDEYRPWSYVNYDGHPNFLRNYIGASAIYNHLMRAHSAVQPRSAGWYKEVPTAIDFSHGDFNRFLFGQWHPVETDDPPDHRWMGDSGRALLRNPGNGEDLTITIKGKSNFIGRNTSTNKFGGTRQNVVTLLERGVVIGQQIIPDHGSFTLQFPLKASQDGLLFLNIVSSRSFRPYISGIGKDERQLSILVSSISADAN